MTLPNTVDLQEKLRLAEERTRKENKQASVKCDNMQWLDDSSDEESEEQDPEKVIAEELAVKLRVPKTPRQLDYSMYRAAQLRHAARNPPPKNIKEFDGVVTQFFEDTGFIDCKIYFLECLTYDAPLPFKVGDKVHVKAKLRRDFDEDEQIDEDDWVAYSVQLIEPDK
uniref:Uncharacterized protein n=1 Tax=Ditylenchus dipsaci TaxID=166011 RepID=A0A915EK05_9BILA